MAAEQADVPCLHTRLALWLHGSILKDRSIDHGACDVWVGWGSVAMRDRSMVAPSSFPQARREGSISFFFLFVALVDKQVDTTK